MKKEAERLQMIIDSLNKKIEYLKVELNKQGIPAGIPRGYLQKYTEIQNNIDKYKSQNKNYNLLNDLRASKKVAAEKLKQISSPNNLELWRVPLMNKW